VIAIPSCAHSGRAVCRDSKCRIWVVERDMARWLSCVAAVLVLGCVQDRARVVAQPTPTPAPTSSAIAAGARAHDPERATLVTPSIATAAQPGASDSPEPSASPAFVALEVPDFSPSIVHFPSSNGKAPVLVVTHGAGGTPEAHCELWARITQGKAVLLCVRGRARSQDAADGDYYPDHPSLERETFAALAALRAGFADRIASGPVFYAGFSQGATMGALMLVPHASEVTRLILVEGGFADWNVARAQAFRAQGGERVLFVCGRKECAEPARTAAQWFNAAGVAAQVEYVKGAGHSHDARVEARITALYSWFVAGDPRFANNDAVR
jgi:predicted esterase